ncbi:ribonuclease J [Caldibacillus thermolactis]|jgi:ribonuclease J|uniref:Ribonuclease J n=1 Tax=Pallidibacillus thermolactis TaxID=251051 RepID=A0ABT2WC43_9BACI|nr:ribonuclease J [Pallidibacillus thermolactis]MCU9593036.1 ribonuclease J [Pallidibacillus thermolactis]MED1672062.1 ribonuclease J [Pallidibacillus thermolactis subsp. kokeshiiformis]
MFFLVNEFAKSIKILCLGGVGELGKNMYVVEVHDDLFVIDAGLMFPEDEMFGIDIVIPDYSYLVENKNRIRGIFLSHGHEDHIGAIPYILRQIDVPVYGTRLTLALTKIKLKEHGLSLKIDFREVKENTQLTFEHAKITFFHVNHSIPDAVGICIETSEGNIVYTGDFKFDQSADPLYRAHISKMTKIGDRGVLCLLSDSTESEKEGYTPSEITVAKELDDVFKRAKSRIIFACYASQINAIQRLINAAYKSERKVAIVGRALHHIFQMAAKNGYLYVPENLIIVPNNLGEYPDNKVVVLMSGNQGEPLEALQMMVKRSYNQIQIQKGDTVIIAASPHRGGEQFLIRTVDMLYRAGANVISGKRVHVSGHGRREELKLMINLMKPKFFVPIHGEYKMLVSHAQIAEHMGIPSENIFIPEKGDVIEIKHGKIRANGRVTAGNILIDGSGVGDVGNIVLRDRKMLSQDGIFIVVVTINRDEKKIASGPEIISRGFVYVRESEELMGQATKLVKEIVEKNLRGQFFEWSNVKQEIRDSLNGYLFNKTKRRPMIIPIIMEI